MSDTTINLEDLKALFDLAVQSPDFTSGVLCDGDVELLRRIAVVIGVDPWEGTPGSHASRYPHEFKRYPDGYPMPPTVCYRCGRAPDRPYHEVTS